MRLSTDSSIACPKLAVSSSEVLAAGKLDGENRFSFGKYQQNVGLSVAIPERQVEELFNVSENQVEEESKESKGPF